MWAYFFIGICFIFACWLIGIFNKLIIWFQFLIKIYSFSFLNISYVLGVDGFSLGLFWISSCIILLCFLFCWYIKYMVELYILLLLSSLFCLLNVFCMMDFFYFFLFFESLVIPMFFLIGVWGSRVRRIYAGYQLFLYTLFGSIFILWCFISIYLNNGSCLFEFFFTV